MADAAKKSQIEIYKAHRSDALEESILVRVKEAFDALYSLDQSISLLAYELNRAQRLMSPRLSLPFYPGKGVSGGYGQDYEPVWVWQVRTKEGVWIPRKVNNSADFKPHSYFKMKMTAAIVGNNERPVRKLLTQLVAMLKLRAQAKARLSAVKGELIGLTKLLENDVYRRTPVIEELQQRIVSKNFVVEKETETQGA